MEGVPGAALGWRLTGAYKGKTPKGSVKSEREQASRDNIYQIMMVFNRKAGLTPTGTVCRRFPPPNLPSIAFSPENWPGPGISAENSAGISQNLPKISPNPEKSAPKPAFCLKIGLPAAPIGAEPPRPGPRRRPGPGPGGRPGGRQPSCGAVLGPPTVLWGRPGARQPSCGPSWGRWPTKD